MRHVATRVGRGESEFPAHETATDKRITTAKRPGFYILALRRPPLRRYDGAPFRPEAPFFLAVPRVAARTRGRSAQPLRLTQ
jgi:hypothetical protein